MNASFALWAPDLVNAIQMGVILLWVQRIPDMFRSTVNLTSHMVWAVVVERMTGMTDDRESARPEPGSAAPKGPRRSVPEEDISPH